MNYPSLWPEIAYILTNKVKHDTPENIYEQKVLLACEKLGWSQYRNEIRIKPSMQIGRSNRIEPDIVLYESENNPIAIVEVKRPSVDSVEHQFVKQLYSYMRVFKVDLGVLIGSSITVFYDEPSTREEPLKLLSFDIKDSPSQGETFANMFSHQPQHGSTRSELVAQLLHQVEQHQRIQSLHSELISSSVALKLADYLQTLFPDVDQATFYEVFKEYDLQIKKKNEVQETKRLPRISRPSATIVNETGGNYISLADLKSVPLGKEHRPVIIMVDGIENNVSNWTQLINVFVHWLVVNKYLKQSDLPVLAYAQRDKYFLNREPQHQTPGRNGAWNEVMGVFVDGKYNADGHKKNMLYCLEMLSVSADLVKIKFA
jgi:hypothetical protein